MTTFLIYMTAVIVLTVRLGIREDQHDRQRT